ncbi:MAG: hypothetical protein ABI904_23235 [Chloroflexota bacterium]
MATHGRLTWNLDDYLEQFVKAEEDVDQVVTDLLKENRPYVGGLLYNYLRKTSESWTGATAKTIFVSPVQKEGNYIFIEAGADTTKDPAGWYKEFGRPKQAAEPFLRPTFIFLRTKELRRLMKKVMENMGLPT